MKIDLHTHILPRDWPDLVQRYGYGPWPRMVHAQAGCARMMIDEQLFREIEDNCWDADRRREECKRHRVDVQVLSTVPVMFSYWARPRDTLDLSRILNDHIASVIQCYPRNFVGLGTLPMQAPDLAIEELRRCVQDLGFAGAMIGSHVNSWNLDEEPLFDFFAAAAEMNAALFVHPWDMWGLERMPRYFLPWLVAMPAETSLAMCSVIFSGLLDRLPNLRLCFAHGGGSFPMTIGRIDRGFSGRPDLCQVHVQNPPSSYLRRLYVDSLVHDAEVLRYNIQLFGADRIMLGSDYPFPLGEAEPGALIESMSNLEPEVRALLLGGTALEFLGLKASAFSTATEAHASQD